MVFVLLRVDVKGWAVLMRRVADVMDLVLIRVSVLFIVCVRTGVVVCMLGLLESVVESGRCVWLVLSLVTLLSYYVSPCCVILGLWTVSVVLSYLWVSNLSMMVGVLCVVGRKILSRCYLGCVVS